MNDDMTDAEIDRFVDTLRRWDAHERMPHGLSPRLGQELRRSSLQPAARPLGWWPSMRLPWSGTFQVVSMVVLIAIAGSLAYGLRGSWLPGGGDPSNLEGGIPAADGGTATPVDHAVWPSAEQIMAGCPVQRRPEGSVEAMLAATTWHVPISIPIGEVDSYPIFVQSSAAYGDPLPSGTVQALNTTLAGLFPCTMQDLAAGLISPQLDGSVLDNYYMANFSDNLLRRWLLGGNPTGSVQVETAFGRFNNRQPPTVTIGWDIVDTDVPRVQAFVANPNPPFEGSGWLMNFVSVAGAWQIDEFANAVLDAAPVYVGWPSSGQSIADIALFDSGQNPSTLGGVAWSNGFGGPTYAGEGMMLRVYNFGSSERHLVIKDLDIDLTIAPGDVLTTVIDGPPGTYAGVVSQNGATAKLANITFLAPGTIFQGFG
jgi:hypothetical protein